MNMPNLKLFLSLSATFLVLLYSTASSAPRTIRVNGCNYPILGISINHSADRMVITAPQGRVFCLTIADLRSQQEVTPIWKNLKLSGFAYGGKPAFSKDDRYILLQESSALKTAPTSKKVKDIKYVILDSNDGSIVFEGDDVNSVEFVSGQTQILLSSDKGISIKDFISKQTIRELSIDNCEIAAINHSVNKIAVSYDPEKADFKEIESIGNNKKELKNSMKNKRLVSFYSYPDLKKLYTSNEELDIVYTLKFSHDDKQLFLFSRNVKPERVGTSSLNTLTIGAADNRRQSNIQVLNSQNGDLIESIYHATAEADADFKLDPESKFFGYSDNDGWIGWKRKLVIFNHSDHQPKIAQYRFQGKRESSNIFPIYFSFLKGQPIAFVSNGLNIVEWDFQSLPEYTDYIEGKDQDSLQITAIRQLNRDLGNPESVLCKNITKQDIKGLYLFDITIQKKGQVITIFTQSDEKTNIAQQNILKDILMKYKFENIDVLPNQRLKIKYTFNIQ